MPDVRSLFEKQTHRLSELLDDAQVLLDRSASSPNEASYLRLVRVYLEASIAHLEKERDKFSDLTELSRTEVEDVVSVGKQLVARADQALHHVHKLSSSTLPTGTSYLIQDMIDRATDSPLEFFLNISSAEEYSVLSGAYSGLLNETKGRLQTTVPPELDKNIVVLNIFANQTNDVLRHPVFGHELGHALLTVDDGFIQAHLSCEAVVPDDPEQSLADFISSKASPDPDWDARAVGDWIEELFADCVGVHLLGPPALFAILEMANEEMDFAGSAGDQHPPVYKRLDVMQLLLKKSGLYAVLPEATQKQVDELIEYIGDYSELDGLIPEDAVRHISNFFSKDVIERIASRFFEEDLRGRYTADEFTTEVPQLKEQLELGVAACQLIDCDKRTFSIPSGASLINAGWLIQAEGRIPTRELNALLAKGLENLYLNKVWAEERCQK